ncbi:BglG family transcription antiterminator [Clostridium sp. CF011]|uniref:BglG family transcription antiterminator n=1 Tax=Clostridium sp. CF011 TaxID=2843318 RepID=UPI001C0CA523|nr:BglG family transcription antiterminator [Clostridium sp. CF011]MBU3093409.1 BglG family transcription antiterminator [Clostridium sp. CF011]WAG71256.1 BglG family transcription antiterminator [Clostridium sp. CF011]
MICNLRLQKILHILLCVDKIVTGEYLCNTLGVSSRTIRSDIKELNYILEDKGAIILSEKSRGYRIEILKEKTFKEFLSENKEKDISNNLTAIERAEYIITRLLINELKGMEGITQIELADELYVSLSSLKNDIKLAKITLVKFSADIEKIGNKGIKITGSEENIRYCINRYVLASNKEIKNNLDILIKKILGEKNTYINYIIKNNISKFNFRLSDIAYRDIQSYLIIMIIRNYYHKNISYDADIRKKLKIESKIKIAKSVCNEIKDEFGIDLIEEEMLYLTKHIMASSHMETSKETEEYYVEEDAILRKILASINNSFNINFTNDNMLINFLGHHLKVSINRARYGIRVENSMLSVIKNNYPFALELSLLANKIIKEETDLNLTEDDIGFIALHFAAAIERKNKNRESTAKKVIIVCTTGVGTSLLLKVKLESHFKNRLNIVDTIPRYELNDDVIEKADLIISTVPLDIRLDKVIYIKSLLDSEEIKLIEENIDNKINNTNGLVSKLKENLFFKNVVASNRDDLLDFMTKELIKREYINENVRESIFKREEIASTEIGELVAVPHHMSEDINESFIAVAVLRKGITWSKEQVQLVLLIGMAVKDRYEWKNCLEHLYKNIIDIEVVKNIIKCNDFEELNKIISKF